MEIASRTEAKNSLICSLKIWYLLPERTGMLTVAAAAAAAAAAATAESLQSCLTL